MTDRLFEVTRSEELDALLFFWLSVIWVPVVLATLVAMFWRNAGAAAWLQQLEEACPSFRQLRLRAVSALRDLGDRALPLWDTLPGAAVPGVLMQAEGPSALTPWERLRWSEELKRLKTLDLIQDECVAQQRDATDCDSPTSGADSQAAGTLHPLLPGKSKVLAFGGGTVPATVIVRQATEHPTASPVDAGAVEDAAPVPSAELPVDLPHPLHVETIARDLHRAFVVAEHGTAAAYRDESFDELPLSARSCFRRAAQLAARGVDVRAREHALNFLTALHPDFERQLTMFEVALLGSPTSPARPR